MIIINHLEKHEVFDLTEALYTWCILNHQGQNSNEYLIQSQLSDFYNPGMGFSESDVELNNDYYHAINEDNYEIIYNKIYWYINSSKWEE